jgi:hypothetical protein
VTPPTTHLFIVDCELGGALGKWENGLGWRFGMILENVWDDHFLGAHLLLQGLENAIAAYVAVGG